LERRGVKMRRELVVLTAIILAVSFFCASGVMAEEKRSAGKAIQNFGKKVINYPAKVVKESGTTVVNVTKNTTDVVATAAKDTASVASGELGKTGDLVMTPIKGTAETVGEAAKDPIEIPIKAAQE